MKSLSERVREDEVMDSPDLDVGLHHQALAALRRVNLWSGIGGRLAGTLADLAKQRGLSRLRVLDLASGGGDVSLSLVRSMQRRGVAVELDGWDRSETAVDYATAQAKRRGQSGVRFLVRDVLNDPVEEAYDVVLSTLFLHHLENSDATRLLQKMRAAAGQAVLVDDLLRTRTGYWLAQAGTRLLTFSPVVHVDGPMSVRAAFSLAEVHQLADQAELTGATVRTHWPSRFLLCWQRP
ncbi:MAG: methyltransferase domain-containing protein [Planctomycetaceae bacterium]|nr:methyltransferase domain-containing protein [Planctomycetaceae bacterium]